MLKKCKSLKFIHIKNLFNSFFLNKFYYKNKKKKKKRENLLIRFVMLSMMYFALNIKKKKRNKYKRHALYAINERGMGF